MPREYAEFDGMPEEFTKLIPGIAERREPLRAELRDAFLESRRHTQMVFESLQHDVRMLIEQVATIIAKLDARQR